MRAGIHPEYRTVVFRDTSSGATYRTRSTIRTEATIELDGETLPVVNVEISAASHPFWTPPAASSGSTSATAPGSGADPWPSRSGGRPGPTPAPAVRSGRRRRHHWCR
jgi:ribosomal protein L31